MRGFLSESEKGYYDLRVNGRVFATNDWRGGISTANSSVRYKLNGVLCETLILEKTTRKFLREKYFTKDNQIDNESSFEWGYLSALEDNEDKLFTIEEMNEAISIARVDGSSSKQEIIELIKEPIKIEFEFEIEMEWNPISQLCDECGNGGIYMKTPCDHPNDCKHWSPKLCEKGYLILKEI